MPEDIDRCVDAIEGREGVDDPHQLCNWMKNQGYDLPANAGDDIPEGALEAYRAQGAEEQDETDQKRRDQPHKDDPDPGDRVRSPARAGLDLRFSTPFKADLAPESGPLQRAFPKARTLRMKGTFIDDSVNDNRWGVPVAELVSIARQLASGTVQLRVDHAEEVAKVVGMYDGGILMDAPAPLPGEEDHAKPIPLDAPESVLAKAKRVDFTARMTTEDSGLIIPILSGFVKGVSPNVLADHVECGVCGKAAMPMPTCAHFDTLDSPGWYLLRDVRVKEGSIVATPAYAGRTPVLPVGFAAGVTDKTKELRSMAGEEAAKKAAAGASDDRAALLADRLTLAEERRAHAETQAAEFKARLVRLETAATEKEAAEEKAATEAAAAKLEADAKAALEAKAKAGKPPTLEERIAATRAGAKAGTTDQASPGPPLRPRGAMSGSLHTDASQEMEYRAIQEIREAHAGKRPLGRFGGLADGIVNGGDA